MRIKALDGFRAVAVLGVLWAHVWMFLGNPTFSLLHVNVAGLLSFFGTGVDLFFVISGFCMYLMYLSQNNDFTWGSYFGYLKKRWLRIAPAFYAAIIVYGLMAVAFNLKYFDYVYAIKHALFIKNFFADQTQYAPHFWSLCTEWHFYLFLPLVVLGIKRFSFNTTIAWIIIFCLIIRFCFWINVDDPFNIFNYSILNRLIEFMMGIIIAKLYLDEKTDYFFRRSYIGILTGFFIAFAGRVLMSDAFHGRQDLVGLLSRIFDLPLLSFGYSTLIIFTLKDKSIISRILESGLMTSIGRYSYSMYLWHWIVAGYFSSLIRNTLHLGPFLEVSIVFIVSLIVLYPISMLSFLAFESVYFRARKK